MPDVVSAPLSLTRLAENSFICLFNGGLAEFLVRIKLTPVQWPGSKFLYMLGMGK